jgi:hypothetical protein
MGDEIIKVLDALGDKLGIAIDWTSENILPQLETVCGKAVQYELWTSVFWIAFGGLMLMASIILFALGTRICQEKGILWEFDIEVVCFAFGAVLLLFAVPVIGVQIVDIITCNVFPEKVLYDFIMNTTH